ncbi:CBS domain-containing protein [Patescibacteria group bacterium]|nr:CBS domain-containing protein [Patescibacteria group bacterium]
MNIQNIMRQPVIVKDNISLSETVQIMMQKKRNSVVIVNDKGEFVSEVDVVSVIKAILPDYIEEARIAAHFASSDYFIELCKKSKDIPIGDFMMKNPKTTTIESSLMEAAVMLINSKQSRIAVLDKNKFPVGLLTRTELKQAIGKILDIKESNS